MHIVVAILLVILLSHKASGQELPQGITLKNGVYLVERSVLQRYKRKDRAIYSKLAKENGFKYKIVPNKK